MTSWTLQQATEEIHCNAVFSRPTGRATHIRYPNLGTLLKFSDVNKDWTCKDKDDLTHKDKDFTDGYLLQVAAKPTIAIKQQQLMNTKWKFTINMTVKPITLNK